MFKIFRFIKNKTLLFKRLNAEEARQKDEGFSITMEPPPESYVVYREGNREVAAGMSFMRYDNVRLYTNSFVKWSTPRGEELTAFDYQKVLNRLVRYFSCWGGEVILDDSHIADLEEIKESLRQRGIPFKEIDGVLVYESTVEKEMKSKNSFFNKN
jgi:hypothetical protein